MLESYEKLSVTQKNSFTDVANKLLCNTFLARDKDNNRNDYYFVVGFKDIFEEFFKILNYELVVDINVGAIMLQSSHSNSVVKLKKDETIVLLIIRILFHEKLKETSVSEKVVIGLDDIHTKYNYLEMKKRINKMDLINALRTFRRFNIIEVLGDVTASNVKIVIMPTILYAINTENINEVYSSVSKMMEEVEA